MEKRETFSSSLWMLLAQTFFIVFGAGESLLNQPNCVVRDSSYCSMKFLSIRSFSMACKIKQLCELEIMLADKTNATHLYLSNNNLQVLPDSFLARYPDLVYLSIAHNKIRNLKYDAFKGLNNLKALRLSYNPLRSMSGNLSGLLPSLSVLYVTGIKHWVLEKSFLQLPRLKLVSKLVLLSRVSESRCRYCSLTRNNFSWSPEAPYVIKRGCHLHTFRVNNLSVLAQTLNGTNFHAQCNNHKTFVCVNKKKYYYHVVGNTCWGTTLKVVNCQSFVGSVAALLNLVVLLSIITSRSLRKNVSMLFICNMALSDLFVGIYIVKIGVYLNSFSFFEIHTNSREKCLKIGFLWMLGQSGGVVTSFLLTLERYLVIVYSLKPDVRITRRMAMILISVCWLVAVFLTCWALYYNYFARTFLCVPLRLRYSINIIYPYVFTLTIGSVAILLYLLSFCLYIHIYITTKRAAQNAGIRRESKLAKRISILVGSNIIFFLIPVFFLAITVVSGGELSVREVIGTMFDVIPAFCLSLNSFLNPVIHAFRTDLFKNVLKERFSVIRGRVRSILPSFGGLSLRALSVYPIGQSTEKSRVELRTAQQTTEQHKTAQH